METSYYEKYLYTLESDDFKIEYKQLLDTHKETLRRNEKILKMSDNYFKQLSSHSDASELANEMKTQFLAQMSHEIRTPLSGIMGFIEILQASETDAKKLRYFDIINSSGETLLSVINDILDFSKIESGNLELDIHDFDAKKEFNSIGKLFEGNALNKDIRLELNIDDSIPNIICSDSVKLKQITSNLISNAIKFTPAEGTITFDVRYDSSEKNLYVSVKDDGIGIAKNQQKEIFEAYKQEDETTSRKFGGTGLGLSISYKLVELLEGKLTLLSEKGMGSQFYFTIPITVASQDLHIGKTEEDPVFNEEHILVADDNLTIQLLLEIFLESMNLKCTLVSNGEEAFQAMKNTKYDLIMLDENMPKLSGTSAAKKMIQYEKENSLEHIPIVSITGDLMQNTINKIYDAGMDAYLAKPITKQSLSQVLVDNL